MYVCMYVCMYECMYVCNAYNISTCSYVTWFDDVMRVILADDEPLILSTS